MRGRPEDTIPTFNAMRPDQQAAYRAGYVEPLIEQVQGGAVGVNKARPFTSDSFQVEAAAIAPRGPLSTFRINESPHEAMMRNRTGYSHVVRLDASQARNIAEDQMRQPLIWR
jgi:hypothetical protein